jgi:lipid-A-disaccharide synthase-like uncharacterized protein
MKATVSSGYYHLHGTVGRIHLGISALIGITSIIAAVVLSIGGLLAVKYFVQATDLKIHHDVTDPLSQTVGMMFAVLLGFMISNAMQRFEVARNTVQQEAASLADIFNIAGSLQEQSKSNLRRLCIQYADQIVTEEWPLLGKKNISVPTIRTYREIWQECVLYQPKTQRDSNVHQSLLSSLTAMSDARRLRIEALHNGLPQTLWWVLIMGGLATIMFTYFFGAKNTKLQVIMTGMVTFNISLNIFLLYTFDDPFIGDVMVRPTAFETDLIMFQSHWQVDKQGHDSIKLSP